MSKAEKIPMDDIANIKSALFEHWQDMLSNNIREIVSKVEIAINAPYIMPSGVRLLIEPEDPVNGVISNGVVVVEEKPQPRIVRINNDIMELMMPYVLHTTVFRRSPDDRGRIKCFILHYFVTFQNKPLSSLDDRIGMPNLPNTGVNGGTCLGNLDDFHKGFDSSTQLANSLVAHFWGGVFNDLRMGACDAYQRKLKRNKLKAHPYSYDKWEQIPFDNSILNFDWLPVDIPNQREDAVAGSTLKNFLAQMILGANNNLRKTVDLLNRETVDFILASEREPLNTRQCEEVVGKIKSNFLEELKTIVNAKIKHLQGLDPAAAELVECVFQDIVEQNLLYKSEIQD